MKITPISVSYVDHMGSDLSVVNAARVSFDKESEWEVAGYEEEVDVDSRTIYSHPINRLSDRDRGLISYLHKHDHWSPFTHAFVSLRIKAPLFAARQLWKSHIGLRFGESDMPWNEVSRRYVDAEPEFYIPEPRGRAPNAKQGSLETVVDVEPMVVKTDKGDTVANAATVIGLALDYYNHLLAAGVAPEVARSFLPQTMMTEWWWSGSLMAFSRVCRQRLDPHAQKESAEVARQIDEIIQPLFPVAWKELMNKGTNDSK